jgi:hypothetical protein
MSKMPENEQTQPEARNGFTPLTRRAENWAEPAKLSVQP